uniref:Bilirubin oxidase n=1 Tax=Paramoeba aestuarina TaxID=180227 RepID=A0A7S4UEV3_9EUKA
MECPYLDPTSVEKYVQDLPSLPSPVASGNVVYQGKNMTHYELIMAPTQHTFHPSLGPATVYSFNGSTPGPLFDVMKNQDILVSWINHLGTEHILPVDTSLLETNQLDIGVFAVTHLHGSHSLTEYDGLPDDYVRNGQVYEGYYDNSMNSTMIWYHDHALGITRLNAYAGLAGGYIIRDELELSLNLPSGEYEIPLILQDRALCEDGSLFYPTSPDDPYMQNASVKLPGKFHKSRYSRAQDGAPFPSVVPEFFGNVIDVNGALWPKKEVERKPYRFRTLVATNARTFILKLEDEKGNVYPFTLIGSDGGLLPKPLQLTELRLMGAERADILIDFSIFQDGTELYLKNYGPDSPWQSDPSIAPADPDTTGNVLKFIVSDSDKVSLDLDWSSVPGQPDYCNQNIPPENVITVNLYENYDEWGRNWLELDNLTYMDPNPYQVPINQVVMWEFINHSEDAHPIHLHQIEFVVCGREDRETGQKYAPFKRETGLKDTAECPPNYITRVAVPFDLPGEYVVHCHMLEHEDYTMMRPFVVS